MANFFKRQFTTYQYPVKEINQKILWIDTNTNTNLGAMTKASVSSVLHCPPPPYPKSVGLAPLTTKEEPPMHSHFSDETLKYATIRRSYSVRYRNASRFY
ncbi:Oidioi.mRNA.OKI2018_I69.chr1.g428.t1.cds [Oikopleura dioica]|uniref:Oidioi.mRNA.OKI2018_I69.chr1.g428.t1.cds n=1 Tax=Oikopleura dioica TaxID=34765 RepID=A0ABN7SJV0_OIKDI|nr:Oidioi.mRNA.OKI2018_I69.chr1.g428.t1.cds [Oikopleura dioica]